MLFFQFFGNFFMKNLVYEKLNPYICRCVMEYHLGGCRKTYLLLGVTSVFSRETLTQTTGTDIFNQQDRGLTYGLHAGGVLVVAALCRTL